MVAAGEFSYAAMAASKGSTQQSEQIRVAGLKKLGNWCEQAKCGSFSVCALVNLLL